MPRRSTGPRLYWDRARESWTIIDGRFHRRTGIGAADIKQAERALRDYIESKHKPAEGPNPILADVLAAYAEEHLAHVTSGKHILYDIGHLNRWWGTKEVTDINATTTREYLAHRKGAGSCARRELAFLSAAIQHWKVHHAPLMPTPKIKLPPRPAPRQDFMTRSEAARFLWIARRTPHLARFFLIGWYTGSRRSVITGLTWSMVNLETGIMQRKKRGAVQTKKRSPPLKIGARLSAHLRRWQRMDGGTGYIVHFGGKHIHRPAKSWDRVRVAAGLPEYVTPHILRHSRATHGLKQGVNPWELANALGMSVAVLLSTYGHHAPDWQKDAANVR